MRQVITTYLPGVMSTDRPMRTDRMIADRQDVLIWLHARHSGRRVRMG